MREVTVSTVISAPREEVFDFVADLAGRPAFTDHFMHDYRLARVNPVGSGAAARFRIRAPLASEYAELEIAEADRPRRVVEEIRYGRRGRNRAVAVYDFSPEGGATRVELTTYSEPATLVDRLKEIGAAGWMRRQTKKALERLRMIFEEPPKGELKRATIAGYEPAKAPRFGAHAGMDPSRGSRLPARMDLRRLTLAACVLALAAPLGLAGCGDEEPGVDEPAREGLALELDGVDYNVFITRQLNPRVPPDGAYVTEEAPAGETLYGVFIQVCNNSDEPRETVSEFVVKDNQENTFEPEELPEDNQFAYSPRTLNPEECIPEAGSVAQLGPSAGSMLLFRLPLENTENRPLELELEGEGGETLTFELDI